MAIGVLALITMSAVKRANASEEVAEQLRDDRRDAELALAQARAEADQLDMVRQELTTERALRSEADKQIDILVRVEEAYRQSVDDLANLAVNVSRPQGAPSGAFRCARQAAAS